jgi:hypothetical protein
MPIASFGAEEMHIDVHASIESLMAVIALVKKSDDLPIIQIGQQKRESEVIVGDRNGNEHHLEENDPNTMIVRTGIVLGPLNGHGKRYIFKLVDGKWIQISVTQWLS